MAEIGEVDVERSEWVVAGKYKVGIKIGQGSFGEIYHGRNIFTGEDVAIKVEEKCKGSSQLKREAKVYQKLDGEGW